MPDETDPPLGYAGLTLDRMAMRREDAGFVDAEAASPDARTLVFRGDSPIMKSGAGGMLEPTYGEADLRGMVSFEQLLVYLGRQDGAPRFASALPFGPAEEAELPDDSAEVNLRALATDGRLAGEPLALVGYAKSMAAWHARHGFCANCGSPTEANVSGWRRGCRACGALHFPRVDPVAIMLVVHGDRCLLGRQSRFPQNMWSCLAGFVEPGETIEDAARREIKEEAGVMIGAVTYELSQPWPFPSQLMIGVRCHALTDEVTPDLDELEDARWFSREEAEAMLARRHPGGLFAPPPAAIAHHLLRRFVEG